MENCTLKPELLVKYLKAKMNNEKTDVSQDVIEHVENCEDCKAIIENPRKSKMYIKLHDSIAKLSKIEASIPQFSKDDKIQFGQIWKIAKKYSSPSENEGRFVEKTAVEFGIVIDDTPKGILIAPVYMNYNNQEIDADQDMIIDAPSTPLYMPMLVELWNIVEVDKNDFLKFYGELREHNKEELHKKLTLNIRSFLRYKKLSETVSFFRKAELFKIEGIFSRPNENSSSILENVIKKIKGIMPSIPSILDCIKTSLCVGVFNPGFANAFGAADDAIKMRNLKELYEKYILPKIKELENKVEAQLTKDSIILLRTDGKQEEFEINVNDKKEFLSKEGMFELRYEDILYLVDKDFIIKLR